MVSNSKKHPIQLNLSLFEVEIFISMMERAKDSLKRYNEFVEHAGELGIDPEELEEGYRLIDEANRAWADEEHADEPVEGHKLIDVANRACWVTGELFYIDASGGNTECTCGACGKSFEGDSMNRRTAERQNGSRKAGKPESRYAMTVYGRVLICSMS